MVALQQQHPFVQQFFSQAFPFFGAHWHSVVTTPTDDAPKHRLSKNEKNFENRIALLLTHPNDHFVHIGLP